MYKNHFFTVAFFIFLTAFVMSSAANDKKPIDGEWAIKLSPKPNNTLENTDKPFDDVLTIKEKKLSSKVCTKYDFDSSAYSSKVVGKKIEYTSNMKSPKHGTAIWSFVIKGEKIDGTFHWEKGGKKADFTFTGEIKTEKNE